MVSNIMVGKPNTTIGLNVMPLVWVLICLQVETYVIMIRGSYLLRPNY